MKKAIKVNDFVKLTKEAKNSFGTVNNASKITRVIDVQDREATSPLLSLSRSLTDDTSQSHSNTDSLDAGWVKVATPTLRKGDVVTIRSWKDMEAQFGLYKTSSTIDCEYSFTNEMRPLCGTTVELQLNTPCAAMVDGQHMTISLDMVDSIVSRGPKC